MTFKDRLRIKLDAWMDRVWARVPEIILGAGVLAVLATVLWLCR